MVSSHSLDVSSSATATSGGSGSVEGAAWTIAASSKKPGTKEGRKSTLTLSGSTVAGNAGG